MTLNILFSSTDHIIHEDDKVDKSWNVFFGDRRFINIKSIEKTFDFLFSVYKPDALSAEGFDVEWGPFKLSLVGVENNTVFLESSDSYIKNNREKNYKAEIFYLNDEVYTIAFFIVDKKIKISYVST